MKAHDGLLPPLKSGGRHFLDLHSVAAEELRKIIDDAKAQGLRVEGNLMGHPSIEEYLEQGFEIITF